MDKRTGEGGKSMNSENPTPSSASLSESSSEGSSPVSSQPPTPGAVEAEEEAFRKWWEFETMKVSDAGSFALAEQFVFQSAKAGWMGRAALPQAPVSREPAAAKVANLLSEVHRELGGAMDYIRGGEGESALGRIETAREKLDEAESVLGVTSASGPAVQGVDLEADVHAVDVAMAGWQRHMGGGNLFSMGAWNRIKARLVPASPEASGRAVEDALGRLGIQTGRWEIEVHQGEIKRVTMLPAAPEAAGKGRDLWMLEIRGMLDPRYWATKEEDAQEYVAGRLFGERPRIVHLREVVEPPAVVEAASPARELALEKVIRNWLPALRAVVHKAFHACDDSEERMDEDFIRIDPKQFQELCEALGAFGDDSHEGLELMDEQVRAVIPDLEAGVRALEAASPAGKEDLRDAMLAKLFQYENGLDCAGDPTASYFEAQYNAIKGGTDPVEVLLDICAKFHRDTGNREVADEFLRVALGAAGSLGGQQEGPVVHRLETVPGEEGDGGSFRGEEEDGGPVAPAGLPGAARLEEGLTWTREKPTRDGYYWVTWYCAGPDRWTVPAIFGRTRLPELPDNIPIKFAGPIVEPGSTEGAEGAK